MQVVHLQCEVETGVGQPKEERELEQRDEELGRQRRAVDALGKAIELLHPSGDAKNSEPDPAAAPTPDPAPTKKQR